MGKMKGFFGLKSYLLKQNTDNSRYNGIPFRQMFLRVVSTIKITNGEQGALRKFSASRNLSFIEEKSFQPLIV